jgi:hypothetical protein
VTQEESVAPLRESHLVERIGWLRAAVLGANDGIISTASLILGVASAAASKSDVLLSGVAGLVAGAMSMAAGEYVSVSSQLVNLRIIHCWSTRPVSDEGGGTLSFQEGSQGGMVVAPPDVVLGRTATTKLFQVCEIKAP